MAIKVEIKGLTPELLAMLRNASARPPIVHCSHCQGGWNHGMKCAHCGGVGVILNKEVISPAKSRVIGELHAK